MVKDDWPWLRLLHERPFTREGNYLFVLFLSASTQAFYHNKIDISKLDILSAACLSEDLSIPGSDWHTYPSPSPKTRHGRNNAGHGMITLAVAGQTGLSFG